MRRKITPELIPMIAEGLCTETDDTGAVVIIMRHRGLLDRIAQRILGKPEVSHIHLDETAGYVWSCIDGSSIMQIGERVKKRFGSKAEPLYPRLILFFTELRDCGFVEMANSENTLDGRQKI